MLIFINKWVVVTRALVHNELNPTKYTGNPSRDHERTPVPSRDTPYLEIRVRPILGETGPQGVPVEEADRTMTVQTGWTAELGKVMSESLELGIRAETLITAEITMREWDEIRGRRKDAGIMTAENAIRIDSSNEIKNELLEKLGITVNKASKEREKAVRDIQRLSGEGVNA